ncbi:GDSL family lipase [Acidipila sp. EB88]|nr:GDSL family lipase [Acidipila sp. EB88]
MTPPLKPLPMLIGGRVLTTQQAAPGSKAASDYSAQWPGAYYRAAFKGSAVFFGVGTNNEILHILVDGQPTPPLSKPEPGEYAIDGLSEGPHTISVLVATESQSAPNHFGGFAIPLREKALAVPQRPRQIEFIGDSHTVGYGNTSPRHQCTQEEIWALTDDTQAFGAMTAAHYNADYQVNAISGRGVVRNYNGFKGDTLLEAYPYTLLDHKQPYQDAAWKPGVIVIALGTNDFSTALNPGEPWKTRDELHADYEAHYERFLAQLRARNHDARIIVWATDVANGEVEAEAQKVVDHQRSAGDQHVTFLPINGLSFSACDGHPSLSDDAAISDKLIHRIDAEEPLWP